MQLCFRAMAQVPCISTLMDNIIRQILRQTLNDTWSRYALKIFARVSQPFPAHQPKILKQIRLYELTQEILSDREKYLDHVDELIAVDYDEVWTAVYTDLRHHAESYNEFLILTRRFQYELIRDIHVSREWIEFRRHALETVAFRRFN